MSQISNYFNTGLIPPGTFVETLTGNTGGAVGPDGTGTIHVIGSGNINVAGNAGTNTETITLVGTTNHAVQVGNASGSLTSIPVGLTGQVLTGVTGGDPVFAAPAASGITTIDGTTGSATGSTVTFGVIGNSPATGGSAHFDASGSTVELNFSDSQFNIAIGDDSLDSSPSVSYSIALGVSAGQNIGNTVSGNVFIGPSAGQQSNSSHAVYIGSSAGGNQAGDGNVAIGIASGNNASGLANVYIGNNAGTNVAGATNVCIGAGAGSSATGTDNIYLGQNSGSSVAGSYNIYLGFFAGASINASNTLIIGNGTGLAPGQLQAAFIAGINGTTIGSPTAVFIDTATDQLSTVLSSRKLKENIEDMGDYSNIIYNLRPITFNYIDKPTKYQLPGLIAEEVHETMPSLALYDKDGEPLTVRYHDLPALLLNEIQKLRKELDELKRRM